MRAKSLVQLSAIACLAVTSFVTAAEAQRGWRYEDRGGYGYRSGCLSSDGINDSLARRGLYPRALVGQSPDGQVLHMQVLRGNQSLIATIDGCSGRILRMQNDY